VIDARDAMYEPILPYTEDVARQVVDSAIEVHRVLGPGLLETTYEHCLAHELGLRRIVVARQVPLPLVYKGEKLDAGYRIDLVVGAAVVVEVKCATALAPIHEAQLLTYLRLSGRRLGLLINFHVPLLKLGLKRIVL
jgi:GxxExxY protein